jgi:hypothetical protein
VASGTLKAFFSYAHEDVDVIANLQKHLAPLRHEEIVEFWYDRDLVAGENWDDAITSRLEDADIVIVIVSSDFVSSEYAYGKELSRALELHERGQLRVVPVIARNCRWQNLPIGRLQALPESGRPITSWTDRDDAYVSVALGIEEVARQLLSIGTSLVDDWLTSRLIRRRVIRAVQEHLTSLGFDAGPLDGIPGRKTEDAVAAFQRAERLTVDRRIGPEVIQKLEELTARRGV